MSEHEEEMSRRLAAAEQQVERSKVVMESLAGFCHALGQPAQVLLSSIEVLQMPNTDKDMQSQILSICYDAVTEIRDVLAQMKQKREWVAEAYLPNNAQAGNVLSIPKWHEKTSSPSEG